MCTTNSEVGIKTKREVQEEDEKLDLTYQIAKRMENMFSDEDKQKIRPVMSSFIYTFTLDYFNDLNNCFLSKVGYTEIGVDKRLMQWSLMYPSLIKLFEIPAYVKHNDEFYYFTDHLIHKLLRELQYEQTTPGNKYFDNLKIPDAFRNNKISREFFVYRNDPHQPITKELVEKIIKDEILQSVIDGNTKYHLPTSREARQYINQNYLEMPEKSFTPYEYQSKAIRELTDKLLAAQNTTNKCVLLDAPTRSGKTFIIFKTINEFRQRIQEFEKITKMMKKCLLLLLVELLTSNQSFKN